MVFCLLHSLRLTLYYKVKYMGIHMNITLPAPEPKKDELLNVPIDSGLKDELRKLSTATGLSMAEITRRWLSYGVEQSNRGTRSRERELGTRPN